MYTRRIVLNVTTRDSRAEQGQIRDVAGQVRHAIFFICIHTEAGAVILATLLAHNTQLTALHMSGNPLGMHGARALYRLLVARSAVLQPVLQATTTFNAQAPATVATLSQKLWISRRASASTASSALKLRLDRPDGIYLLDLSLVKDRALAIELAVLAHELAKLAGDGCSCWKVVCLHLRVRVCMCVFVRVYMYICKCL